MEKISGNILIRVPDVPMKKGDIVIGHQHNFDHTTFCPVGGILLELLDVHETNADGHPLNFTVIASAELWAGDNYTGQNWQLIKKGCFHKITALADGTIYQCVYSHRTPQAFSVWPAGQQIEPPLLKVDADGDTWMRIDDKIVQDSNMFGAAYG